jgi:GT2 family glycosyltransferase
MSGVTAIIPTWNRRDLLERVLESLRGQTRPPQEILVVDNGSEDGSIQMAAAKGARVIQLGRNAGFSKAVNRGIREANTSWVAVINNDVEAVPDWLERLLEAASQPAAWFATGRLLSASRRDRIDATYDLVCRGGCPWRAGHGCPDGPQWGRSRWIRLAPFTAALFRAELFDRVGLLDERFESYLEDVDFGLRCALKGYSGVYVPEARAYHTGSATLGAWHPDTVRRTARNQVFLVAKHYSKKWLVRYGWAVLVAQTLWGLVALRHGTGLAFLRGKIEAIRQFHALRGESPSSFGSSESDRLGSILRESELELFDLQQHDGFDYYWRLYFALT